MKTYLHSLLDEDNDPVVQKYLEYIKTGFPKPKGKKKDVLVVGAGMAGMVAASVLRESGHNVTIVEANTRIGGRVKTFRNTKGKKYWEDDTLYAEAGAMRLPNFHNMVLEYCKQLDVPLEPFYYVSVDKKEALKNKEEGYVNYEKDSAIFPKKTFNSFLYVNYQQVVQKEYYKKDADINKLLHYNVQTNKDPNVPDENQAANILLHNALQPLKDFIAINPVENWPKLIEKLGEYSMRRFLKEFTNYSENAIEMIAVIQNLESRMAYDFLQSFIEANIIKNDTVFWQVVGGTDVITESFYKKHELAEITYLDTKMTDLYLRDGKVRISTEIEIKRDPAYYEKIGFEKQEVPVSEMEFDEVIVTIPFSAFRMVHVWPKFSQDKRKAIRELHYDSATKVLVEFKERWWEKDPYNIVGGGTITDLSNRFIYYPSQHINREGNGLMLACYCWADDARKWDSMSHKDRYIYALDNIAVAHAPDDLDEQRRIKSLSVFNPDAPEDPEYVDGIKGAATVSWMQNPYAFGEAAIFSPGQLHLLQSAIEKPEWNGKAHFAGEHTSLKHAWIEGAIESGIRAALAVNETPVEL
ncbi:flavin monoamine oxidase family protein [Aquimarina sp. SS2-1]|uniref:flavin monoamine oxidase family protein n=1 Tax=Aquimarina besae TaxID=3342247 RepID=UPI003670D5B4